MKASKKYDRGRKHLASIIGQRVTVSRPDYTAVDQTPVLVRNILAKVETCTPRYSQSKIPNCEYYAFFGDILPVESGDVITVVPGQKSTTPTVTIESFSPGEECVGIKTTRVGSIRNGTEDVYTNVRFDFLPGSNYPGSPLQRQLQNELGVPSTTVVMYFRDLATNTRDAEGLFLVETDVSPEVRWRIEQVNRYNNVMQMVLERDI